MFREIINNPVDPIPKEYTDTLARIDHEPDYSLTSLGVAVLKPRIEGYEGIDGCYSQYTNSETCINNFLDRTKAIDTHPLFCYYRYESGEFNKAFAELKLGDFKLKENITAFVKDKMNYECYVYYHETMSAVGIFVNSSDFRLYHLLLSFISLYYPSLFKDKPMSKEEFDIVKSINNKTAEEFFKAIRVVIEPYAENFRRIKLSSMMKNLHEHKISSIKSQIDNQRYKVEQAENSYSAAVRALKDFIVQYEGLVATENYDEKEQELVEYLCKCKNVHNIRMENDMLVFSASSYLNNFSLDAWDAFSRRGSVYNARYGDVTLLEEFKDESNRKLLLDNIFCDDAKIMVKIVSNYYVDLRNCRVTCDRSYSYTNDDPTLKSYIPNPHVRFHGCLGQYKEAVMEELKTGNYMGAIELCIASAGSVNLDETALTFYPFLGQIMSSKEKIIHCKNGTDMTPVEALAWLKGEKK